VSDPARSVRALRQIPNGLIPNFTHGLTCLIRSSISRTRVLTLARRQAARLCDWSARLAKLASSSNVFPPPSGYG
jgi:hypothetical protein